MEQRINKEWYIYNISPMQKEPVKGELTEYNDYNDWKLLKKGKDSWDIGYMGYKDIRG